MRGSFRWYPIVAEIRQHFPHLRPAQQDGLALWVVGTGLAGRGCQNAVIAALRSFGPFHRLRQ